MVVIERQFSCRNTFLKVPDLYHKVLHKVHQCFYLNLSQLNIDELHLKKAWTMSMCLAIVGLYTVKIDSVVHKFGYPLSKYVFMGSKAKIKLSPKGIKLKMSNKIRSYFHCLNFQNSRKGTHKALTKVWVPCILNIINLCAWAAASNQANITRLEREQIQLNSNKFWKKTQHL